PHSMLPEFPHHRRSGAIQQASLCILSSVGYPSRAKVLRVYEIVIPAPEDLHGVFVKTDTTNE
ncbi:MAG: hypothetical protein ACRD3W_19755, partial [Terriglobales bacterium]